MDHELFCSFRLKTVMHEDKKLDKVRRRKMVYAEAKLREAQSRLARAERSIVYWSRILADIRYERTRAVQPPLWPEGDAQYEADPT
jgi:hypothetical protein